MKPVTQINVLSIKPDKVDEFYAADQSYIASATLPKGLIGRLRPLVESSNVGLYEEAYTTGDFK
jgi:hypothetical protein